jgi:LytS/YehU family sensor histidine kinase
VGIFCSVTWICLWIGNARVADLTSLVFSWTEEPAKRFFFGLLGTLIYTLGTVYLLTVTFNWLTNYDVSFEKDMLYTTVTITFVISAFMHGHGFLQNWKQAALDAETSKKESAVARYEALKNQINPHFLFNSLNALTNLVYEDQDKAAKFIKQLSEVYRYVLDTREKEVVTLQEELQFVESYLFLQQIRFGNNLKVNVRLANVTGKIAPLALQLLLENAIKHNVVSSDDPLSIEVYSQEGYICVENNLQKKSMVSENGSGLGLENIKSRYKFLTDKEVFISEASGKFSVKLPIIEMEEV